MNDPTPVQHGSTTMGFGGIGPMELIVMSLICAVPLGAAVVVAIVVLSRLGKRGLLPFKSCGRRVSPAAVACPHCGEPQHRG